MIYFIIKHIDIISSANISHYQAFIDSIILCLVQGINYQSALINLRHKLFHTGTNILLVDVSIALDFIHFMSTSTMGTSSKMENVMLK